MELTARRLTDIYICLMLAAFPLWTGFEGYTGITRAKFLFLAALTGLWLAALALCALKYRARLRRPAGLCALRARLHGGGLPLGSVFRARISITRCWAATGTTGL